MLYSVQFRSRGEPSVETEDLDPGDLIVEQTLESALEIEHYEAVTTRPVTFSPLPPKASSTSAAEEYRPSGALIWAPWTWPRTATNISRATATPSARAASAFVAAAIRARIESGTDTLSSFFINSAFRTLTNGQIPAKTGMRNCSIRRKNVSKSFRSKTGCVTAYSAPASTLYSKRRTSSSRFGAPGFAPTPIMKAVALPIGFPPTSSP